MRLRIGDMAQLVERRVRNAKVRGSNPLISTKIKQVEPCSACFIFVGNKWIVRFFKNRIKVSPCEPLRADADAITEASRSLPTNPLISTTKMSYILYDIFVFIAFSDKKQVPRMSRGTIFLAI